MTVWGSAIVVAVASLSLPQAAARAVSTVTAAMARRARERRTGMDTAGQATGGASSWQGG